MKLVSKSDKPARENAGAWVIARLMPPKDRPRRGDVDGREIGSRFEMIADGIDRAGVIADEIRDLARIVDDLRTPIAQEYEERRRQHAEFMAIKSAYEALQPRLAEAEANRAALGRELAAAEAAVAEISAAREDAEGALTRAEGLIQQLRPERDELRARSEAAESALTGALARISSLEHDLEAQAAELEALATRRREAEAQASRAVQDLSLAQQNIQVLERRLERSAAEQARLQTDFAKAEDRIAGNAQKTVALEAELTQARRETAQFAQTMESRLEASRTDLSAMEAKFDSIRARAEKLEELNTELSHKLSDAGLREDANGREVAELRAQLARVQEEARAAQAEAAALRKEMAVLDGARTAAVGHAEDVAKVAHGRETALKRAEQKIVALKAKVEAVETEGMRKAAALEERAAHLQAELDRERAERNLVEGALAGARLGRARPAAEIA